MTEPAEDLFVNPYTFVPFAEPRTETFKGKPSGHDRLGEGRYLGEIEVELTTRAPLLLRGISREDGEGEFPRRAVASGRRVPYVPGSSLAGVTRSLYEMIVGGCLRVFNADFVPGYRDQAVARGPEWTLAQVESVDGEGCPTGLHLCDTVVWVPAPELAKVLGGPGNVVSGSSVEVVNWERKRLGGGVERLEATSERHVRAGEGWVVLVTDAGARKKRKSYFCAVGRLSTDVGSQRIGLADEEVWADYLASVDETDDVRLARASGTLRPKQAVEADVTYMFADGTRMVGRRHEARPHLFEGQVLWVRVGERSTSVAGREMRVPVVTGLALSAIWRHPGVGRGGRKRGTAGQRVPPQLRPCREPDDLCPACRVFGSVDAEGAEEDQGAEQRSYRGHVRFSDAVPLGEVATRPYDLAPLGAPRPGAGQFYLRNRPGDTAARGTPLREWGSAADRAEPRRLKGRKQYWLTGRFAERPLDRVTDKPFEGKLAARAEAVVEGSVFAYRVHFEGLTVREIGGLLAALAPGEVLADQVPHDGGDTVIGIAVGGGRPFGFGACTTRITGMRIDDARSRYLATGPPDVSAAAALQAFAEAVDGGVKATWPSLAAALHLDHVDPGKVWYPPAEAIPAGPLKKQDLEPGFEFWRQTRGFEHTHGTDRLVALPDADAASQELPVKRREQRERTAPRPGRSGGRQGRRR